MTRYELLQQLALASRHDGPLRAVVNTLARRAAALIDEREVAIKALRQIRDQRGLGGEAIAVAALARLESKT